MKKEDIMEQHYWVAGRNGKRMSVMLHTPENSESESMKYPAILYFHGFTGNKTGGDNRMGVKLARKLAENGYAAVRFDFIGSGDSEGEFESDTFFSGWLQDADVIYRWVKELPQVDSDRIGIVGHSLGGSLTTQFAYQQKEVKALCVISPVTYLEQNFKQITIGKELWEKALQGNTIHNFYNKKYSLSPCFVRDLINYDIPKIAPDISQPYFIIHGKKDAAVPYEHSIELYQMIGSKEKDLVILEEEEHIFSIRVHESIINWFHQYL